MYASCYTYKSLWEPFLKLRNKYIDKNIITYFCTDEIHDVVINSDNINVLNFGKKSNFSLHGNFFERYLYYLNNIDSDYILYFNDDMFPLANVSTNKLNTLIDIMRSDDNIKMIKLSTHSYPFDNGTLVEYNGLQFIKANNALDGYIMNAQPMLINRLFFIDLIKFCMIYNTCTHQNGGLELCGTDYFRMNNTYICLRVIDDIITINHAGGIVRSGIITDETKNMLKDKEDIDIITYDHNLIYKLTFDEYNLLGDRLKEEYMQLNITHLI